MSKSVRLDSTAQTVSHNIFRGSFSENHCVRKQQYLIQVGFEGNREIPRFFPENDFHRTFLPTCKFRCLRQIRSIFLDLLVDPSAFHPHTTKLWKAQCWNQLLDTSWPGLLSEFQYHRAILLSRGKDVKQPLFHFHRSANRSRLLYSKGKWWRLLHSDPVFSVVSSTPVFCHKCLGAHPREHRSVVLCRSASSFVLLLLRSR